MNIAMAKKAAEKALSDFCDLVSGVTDVALEGIEQGPDGSSWSVVIGYNRVFSQNTVGRLADLAYVNPRNQREYKIMLLDGETLELKKMEPYDATA